MNRRDKEEQKTEITFDGYDGSWLACPIINIWAEVVVATRPAVAWVKHGSKGFLLRRKGERCFVEVKMNGHVKRGWVTFFFILELKSEWNEKRLELERLETTPSRN